MKRMICGWLTSGRSTTFSTTMASSTMTPAVTMKASVQCRHITMKPTKESAAKRNMEPWAQLKMTEALKISTKPSATRAKSTPCSRPAQPKRAEADTRGSVSVELGGVGNTQKKKINS